MIYILWDIDLFSISLLTCCYILNMLKTNGLTNHFGDTLTIFKKVIPLFFSETNGIVSNSE
ncbi:hypothetical protein DDV96_09035 [Marixanthomonas spongiae]|uniref:Uncharacterized protein n=1 Tax=Marixanthomonas spongiae TaxID=2174845 RepID=A0A2U0I0N3_9FLAO|nr:hypothetical protein DDV96_09035 [Marixanthomonas spongiae]